MTEQSNALRLADALSTGIIDRDGTDTLAAAAELRRLVKENEKFRKHIEGQNKELDQLIPMAEKLEAQSDALLAVFRESLRHAEWCDKHIYPFDGETFQNWKISIYLPVRLSETDKSPEAALDRLLKDR